MRVNQLSRVKNKEVTAIKCHKIGPIFNAGPVPKTVPWYLQCVCTDLAFEPNFSHGVTF